MAGVLRQLSWASLLFLGMGEELVKGFARSLSELPAGHLMGVGVWKCSALILSQVTQLLGLLSATILPFAVVGLIVEVMVGYLGKVVPQVSFSHETFLLKSGIGFVLALWWWRAGVQDSLYALAVSQVSLRELLAP